MLSILQLLFIWYQLLYSIISFVYLFGEVLRPHNTPCRLSPRHSDLHLLSINMSSSSAFVKS